MTRGGRLPDPGLGALCAWPACGEPREAHGGPRNLGACPGESGLRARRFSIASEDRPPPEPIVVRQVRAVVPVSAELLAEYQADGESMRAWLAMSPEERLAASEKANAERQAARDAAELEASRFLGWLGLVVTGDDERLTAAHLEIIAEHRPVNDWRGDKVCGTCAGRDRDGDIEGDPYPCVTLRALAKAYGWSDG